MKCINRKYKMPDLLCCPFCGQDVEMHYLKYDHLYDGLNQMYWVSCPNCFAEIKNVSATEKEAKDVWNRRKKEVKLE